MFKMLFAVIKFRKRGRADVQIGHTAARWVPSAPRFSPITPIEQKQLHSAKRFNETIELDHFC